VGSPAEAQRARQLLAAAQVPATIIGYIAPASSGPSETAQPDCLGDTAQLPELVRLYGLNELIVCGQDLPVSHIISLMQGLPARAAVAYKILPEGSQYIIGSSSKDAPGDYYTLTATLRLHQPAQRRTKRLLDLVASAVVLVAAPLLIWGQRRPGGLLPHCWQVLRGRRTWVGLRYTPGAAGRAILSPADTADAPATLSAAARQRLEFLYAKDYEPGTDISVLWRCWRRMGE